MADRAIIVTAPARLHLGLVKTSSKPGFIAVGLSLAAPRLRIKVALLNGARQRRHTPEERAAMAVLRSSGRQEAVNVDIISPLPAHHGFGSGTRNALASCAGALRLAGVAMDTLQMAKLAGRGERSAMGSVLFGEGGVAADVEGDIFRTAAPTDWRVVLITPDKSEAGQAGLHGITEDSAIEAVAPCSIRARSRLKDAAIGGLIAGAAIGDFTLFAESLAPLQRAAARQFGAIQGGSASTEGGRAILAWLRKEGVIACGQSSWGPSLFAIVPSASGAMGLRKRLAGAPGVASIQVTRIDNLGRRFTKL